MNQFIEVNKKYFVEMVKAEGWDINLIERIDDKKTKKIKTWKVEKKPQKDIVLALADTQIKLIKEKAKTKA